MKLARRILITAICTVAAIVLAVRVVLPVVLSYAAARQALPVAKIVPTELEDHSVSQALGRRVSCVGYEFEIPWDDLDDSKTVLYPKDKPTKTRAVLSFHSGLRLMVTAIPPREMADEFTKEDFKMPPQEIETVFGRGASTSDYIFVNNVYEFTPAKVHHWSLSTPLQAREMILLTVKSIMPVGSAETGIFRVRNESLKGFQQGSALKQQNRLVVTLYSEDGAVEVIFFQDKYGSAAGVTQPEINRIIQSLHRIAPSQVARAEK